MVSKFICGPPPCFPKISLSPILTTFVPSAEIKRPFPASVYPFPRKSSAASKASFVLSLLQFFNPTFVASEVLSLTAFLTALLSVKLSPTASLIALLSVAPSISWFLAVELVFAAPPKSPPKLVTARNRTSLPVNPPFSVAVCVRSSPYQRRLQPAFYRLCQVHLSRHPWKLQ